MAEKNQKPFDPEEFKMKFRAVMAVLAVLAGIVIMNVAMFSKIAAEGKHTGTVLGFIMGTMLTLVLTYYFGSSDTNQVIKPTVKPPDKSLNEIETKD